VDYNASIEVSLNAINQLSDIYACDCILLQLIVNIVC
jgi:hypothetical protein